MLAPLAFVLAAAADPRPLLVDLQLAGRNREALAETDRQMAARPQEAQRSGFDYLRGHLLHQLGRSREAAEAFAAAMAARPDLALYARFRLAEEQNQMRHPEMAAGLVAMVVQRAPASSALLPEAVRLLASTLAAGGDCRLIQTLSLGNLRPLERRTIQLSRADCALRSGERELARSQLLAILGESLDDESARAAAERLSGMVSETERGRLPRLLGLTFHRHREFERALQHLRRAGPGGGSAREQTAAQYAMGRSYFGQGRFSSAAATFAELARRAERAGAAEEWARALFSQGRAYELMERPREAAACFQQCYLASPGGEWAPAALLSGLRLDWQAGNETGIQALYALLASNWRWREPAARAALFLASSDLVGGRRDRARGWLAQGDRGGREERLETAYWRGRLAELEGKPLAAVSFYLAVMRVDRFHPMGEAAGARLRNNVLAATAAAEGRRLASSGAAADLRDAWLLLGDGDPAGKKARARLVQTLAAQPETAPYLRIAPVPVARWPLWQAALRAPEEILLALGVLNEGAPAVVAHFPPTHPALAFTGARLLARAGETRRSIELAEAVRARLPPSLPVTLLPAELQNLLYPMPYREELLAQARARGVDPHLLAALAREESLFDPYAVSPSAARGLLQLVLPTARRLAPRLELKSLSPEDLYRPELSIGLGAAHLAELDRTFADVAYLTATAYNAGAEQTRLWRSYCTSAEPEEFFTKVGFDETRDYLRRVLTSWAQYERLY